MHVFGLFYFSTSVQRGTFEIIIWMSCNLFMRILQVIYDYDFFFLTKTRLHKKLGLSSIQKCTSKLHMLENGTWANAIDEYHWIANNATMECMKWFMHVVVVIFQSRYL